jgi:hypothetical protein
MEKSRRKFLLESAAGLATGLITPGADCPASAQQSSPNPPSAPPGQPPAFATAPAVGPEVSPTTFAEAQKLVRVDFSAPQLAEAAESWRVSMASLYERRTGPRKVALENSVAPWSTVRAVQPGMSSGPARDRFLRSQLDPGPLPSSEADIAWAPVTHLSRWIEQRKLTSERLTSIHLDRLRRYDPKLRCVITLTPELALQQARRADAEIAAGRYRGPLHGIPWGAKDLLDTAGIATTIWSRALPQPHPGQKRGCGRPPQ